MLPDRMLSVAPLYKLTTTWHRIFASSGFLSFCWRWAVCSLLTANVRLWISSWYEISTSFPTEEKGRKRQGLSTQPWGAPVLSTRVKEVIASPKCLQSVCEDLYYPVAECGSHLQEQDRIECQAEIHKQHSDVGFFCFQVVCRPSGGQWIWYPLWICWYWIQSVLDVFFTCFDAGGNALLWEEPFLYWAASRQFGCPFCG